MACNELLRVHAYLDGESDAAQAVEIEGHMASCAECAALRDDVLTLRSTIREQASYHRADSALRGRIGRALDRKKPAAGWKDLFLKARQFWTGAASGAFATAFAATLVFLLVLPPQSNRLIDDVMSAHLRSLMSDHLIDIASSNHHTVKPWFAGHTDVSPPVADFSREGYTLVGGRADYVYGQRAAVVVYRHGAHIINVFAWTAGDVSLPNIVSRNGYRVVFWKSGNLAFCAVSDTALDELLGLVRLLKETTTPDSRE